MTRSAWIYRFLLVSVVFIMINGMSLNVLAKTEEGLKSYSIGEFDKAEAIFREVLKGEADNAQAGYYLGLTLLMEEKFQEALGIFQNLKDNINNKEVMGNAEVPTKGQVEIGLVRTYLGLKNYTEAMNSLDAAETVKADPIDVHTYKGAYYLEKDENTRANEELEKAIELKSQNPYTYYYSGIVNIRLGNPQKAVKLFEKFLEMAPYAPEAGHAKFLIDTLC